MSTYVVVGGGLAGAKAVETLRTEGFDGDVVLVGAEQERPYERPPLSKAVLMGNAERDSVFVHDRGLVRRARRRPPARHPGRAAGRLDPVGWSSTTAAC